MKALSKLMTVITMLLSSINGFAQIRNAKTEIVKIYGNCNLCKANIEKAGSQKKLVSVDWDKNRQTAILTYDKKKSSKDEILKRIALIGYDSESFRAPDAIYAKLAKCCQYDRPLKTLVHNIDSSSMRAEQGVHVKMITSVNLLELQDSSHFKHVFDGYFSVEDALVNTDAIAAASNSFNLTVAIKTVDMNKLSPDEHFVWMEMFNNLLNNAENISKSKDIIKQRDAFVALSVDIYELAKVSKWDRPVYYQHCPMYNGGKGANWLSQESKIKNPFYGSKMVTCGSTIETLK
ncbi:MAG: mercury transporter [Pseudopedobacter saltans]|uniref:Mercury transporter n=1 Tax=Pseudopedobacter saltans TaxID=151895 RepID=A0A2W5H3R7_9SPHI|nr:MAG: mercury transporter [Pseudopedobacter saltans]